MKINITSKFHSQESFREKPHQGIDFDLPKDSPLYSIQDGVVSRILTPSDQTGFGNAIFLKLENGNQLIFAHLNEKYVKVGDVISQGQLIGLTGNTGRVTGINGGYHLHLGLKDVNGQYINPEAYTNLITNMDNLRQVHSRFEKLDPSEMLRQVMEGMGNMPELKLNFVSQLCENHTIFLIIDLIHVF